MKRMIGIIISLVLCGRQFASSQIHYGNPESPLFKMVRNITGTLVDVARGVVHESRIEELFESGGPYRGYTAPAHGLTLVEVIYPQ